MCLSSPHLSDLTGILRAEERGNICQRRAGAKVFGVITPCLPVEVSCVSACEDRRFDQSSICAYLSSKTSLSLSQVVQSSFGSPPFSAQQTAAPKMPPADLTRLANCTAFASSLKKLSTTNDTPWSSTCGKQQGCCKLPCKSRAVAICPGKQRQTRHQLVWQKSLGLKAENYKA